MAPLLFMAGVAFTLSFIILMLPWLRTVPGLGSLPALPWQAGCAAALTLVVIALWLWFRPADLAVHTSVPAARAGSVKVPGVTESAVDSWADITNAMGRGAGALPNSNRSASDSRAQPMEGAIASLRARLAKSGGSAEDWELLAKSYEFLGRQAEAAKARAHQLPPVPSGSGVVQ